MNKKMICYIASPVKNVLEIGKYTPKAYERVFDLAKLGAIEVKKMGFIPLSPVLLFAAVYNEQNEREEAIANGMALLSKCHCFYEVKSTYKSEGCQREKEAARALGLIILN